MVYAIKQHAFPIAALFVLDLQRSSKSVMPNKMPTYQPCVRITYPLIHLPLDKIAAILADDPLK